MLHCPTVHIGFVTQLLWDRYGPFWQKLFEDAGAEIVMPDPRRVRSLLSDARLDPIPALAFRLVAAQALVLVDADLVVVPDLAGEGEVDRGSGQDPWIASLSYTLGATVGGLPRLLPVPAQLSPATEGRAVEILHQLVHDPVRVRRVWDRNRALARPAQGRDLPQVPLSDRCSVGILGQPWLLGPPLLQVLEDEGISLVAQSHFAPESLRREGERLEMALLPTDRETLGAAHLLSRRGDVERLMVVQDRSGADGWLLRAIRRLSHKPVTGRLLGELPGGGVDLLLASGEVQRVSR